MKNEVKVINEEKQSNNKKRIQIKFIPNKKQPKMKMESSNIEFGRCSSVDLLNKSTKEHSDGKATQWVGLVGGFSRGTLGWVGWSLQTQPN
jgi:hypothetical protein